VQIGKLDRRITIQRAATARGAAGGVVESWVDVCTCWAGWEPMPLRSGESFVADQRTAKQKCVFTIRFREGIDSKMTLLHDGQRYDIEDVEEVPRRRGLRLKSYAREVSPGGR